MAKKHHLLHIPTFGGGFGVAMFLVVDKVTEIVNSPETAQECVGFINSVLDIFG